MSYTEILYDVSGRIATITMNRPDRLNAYTGTMGDEMRAAMRAATDDPGVRVIVLTGAGRGFCAGADMNNLNTISTKGRPGEHGGNKADGAAGKPFDPESSPDYQTTHSYFPAVPKPIIAAINGACAGLGLVYALYCDQRFASADAKFTTAFARRGLIAEHGMSWMLPRLIGHSNALDLLMSARRVSSAEALQIGLVNRLYPADELRARTMEYVKDIVDYASPRAVGVIKRQLYEVPFQTLAEATIYANREMELAARSDDFREGVASFLEKRPPNFSGT